MSTLPCLYCDGPIPMSEAERAALCPLCSRPLTVCGRWRLKALLSKSESDRVYQAVDGEKQAAVKVWLARDDDWATISEFERIARTLQGANNPNLPQIFGWEKGGQGRLILVREQLHGHTLDDRLKAGQRPPAGAVRKLLQGLLHALADTHRQSPPILHRDIQAKTVLFREAGDWGPVLVDFDPRSTGAATTTTDLSAVARVVELAAGGGLGTLRSIVERMANGVHSSADVALRELALDRGAAATAQSPPRATTPPRPAARGLGVVIGLLVGMGMVAGFVSQMLKKGGGGDSTVDGYERQCKRGDALGCYNLGYRYEKGKGVTKDEPRAATLYQKSCDMGEKMACNNLAVLYESGRGVVKDAARAVRLYTRACDQKDWLACRNLGYMYSNGVGTAQDVARAVVLYEAACDHDEVRGCYNLGVLYENGKGLAVDKERAKSLYQRACDEKDWEGCTNLGWMYATVADYVKARPLYQKACDNDDARGCNNLGVIYEKGRNVPLDLDRAFKLYKQACDGDDYYGCYNEATFHESGKATPKDAARAATLYEKSCRLGYDKACPQGK